MSKISLYIEILISLFGVESVVLNRRRLGGTIRSRPKVFQDSSVPCTVFADVVEGCINRQAAYRGMFVEECCLFHWRPPPVNPRTNHPRLFTPSKAHTADSDRMCFKGLSVVVIWLVKLVL